LADHVSLKPVLLGLLGTFALSAALTPVVRRIAIGREWLAHPSADRWHRRPVAVLGGYAIFLSCALGIAATVPASAALRLLIGSALMFVLGALDDAFHFRATTKLAAQTIIAAVIVHLAGPVSLTGHVIVDQLLALGWIVGITNAFNLLDNMDGLSAGTAAIAAVFYLIALGGTSSPLSYALAAFAGATLGFLVYNFQPASIFMGDSGSLFIGSFLASAALFAAPELHSPLAPVAAIPLLILLIPIFDTAFVTVTRRLAGRNPMVGGRDHLSHRLVAFGVRERRAVLAFYCLSALGGAVAISLLHVEFGYSSILIAAYVIVLAGMGIVLGHVEAYAAADAGDVRAPFVSEVAYRNRTYEVLLDVALLSLAYYAAFLVRFEVSEVEHFITYFATSFPIVLACQLAGLALSGKYRQMWRSFGSPELLALLRGIGIGVSASVMLMLYLYRFEGFSRLVFAYDAAFAAFLLIGSRVAITSVDEYLRKKRSRGRPVVIYGAGRGGTLLLRELLENKNLDLTPIGFLDDDPAKRRLRIEGLRVLGALEDLPAVAAAHKPTEVLVSIRGLDRARLASLAAMCRERGIGIRAMRFALEEIGPVPHVRQGSHAS
jgi:UDP-GlcNAc:undecaprenyl-phosphate/decaprenyl-phosphate GlcNAc-1-phosphate transferase